MASSLSIKRVVVGAWWLVACLALMTNPVVALAQFQPGLQHIYPFYYPEGPGGVSPPAILTGLSGGEHPVYEECQHPAYRTPDGYTIPYDCRTLEIYKAEVVVEGISFYIHPGIKDNTVKLFSDLNAYLAEETNEGPVTASGWRSFSTQVQARVDNGCPDKWYTRSTDCTTPTATPGNSNHERGLAVDIRHKGGGTIRHRSEAFKWLQRIPAGQDKNNGELRGFKNLASETWHWSINGQ